MKKVYLSQGIARIVILTIFFISFLPASAICGEVGERDYWPTREWKYSTPKEQGMDSSRLNMADEFVQERLPDAFSLLVVRNGYLVFEKYYSYGSPDKYAVVHSVTKSFMSALIGIAQKQEYLKSMDQKLAEFFPEYISQDTDPRKARITLKHLLTMSAGFKWNDWGPDMKNWYLSPNWPRFTIQLPLENDPGDTFNYNTSISHLLSVILTETTQSNTYDFAKQNLFKPIGIERALWYQGPQGYYIGGFGLGLTARDLAKFGFLYLNKGYWNGESVVPEAWVEESTRQSMPVGDTPYGPIGYGYHWWVKEVDGCFSYRAMGRRGQFVVVIPELDMVIVVTSNIDPLPYPTAPHYFPLFDLVAASVNRERPPKKVLEPARLPADVEKFLADFNQATTEMNKEKIAGFFSDDYLNNGATKEQLMYVLLRILPYWSKAEVVITSIKMDGNNAEIEGVRKDKYYEAPLTIGGLLKKEEGQWKWYGNQLPKQKAKQ